MPNANRPVALAAGTQTRAERTDTRSLVLNGEILIYGVIDPFNYLGDFSDSIRALDVMASLAELSDQERISVRINSPGGSVMEGLAIYNALIAWGKPIDVHIDAMAASIASVIAMAGDTITMAENASVTRAWTSPMEMGAGSVTVRFMMDELRASNNGFPLPADVATVQAHIDALRPVTVKDLFVLAPIPEPINFTIDNLVTDSAETRFNLEAAVAVMLNERARPAYALNGVAQDAQTIHREWVSAAILSAAGVDSFDLTMTDHVMPSKGHIAVPGTVTYV